MLSVYMYDDVRHFLQDEFQRRVGRNNRYSLRAFARDLDITLSRISEVFANGAGISVVTARKIAVKMEMSEYEREYFEQLVLFRYGRNKDVRRAAGVKVRNHMARRNFKYLKENYSSILSRWYYLPLIEMLTINKKVSLAKVAERLELEIEELDAAISYLTEKGFITRHTTGRWTKTVPYIQIESSTPTELIRKYHQKMLKKSHDAIDRQPIQSRKYLTSAFGIRKENLAEARKELEKINQEFTQRYAAEENSDSVYCLSIQLFQLDA